MPTLVGEPAKAIHRKSCFPLAGLLQYRPYLQLITTPFSVLGLNKKTPKKTAKMLT